MKQLHLITINRNEALKRLTKQVIEAEKDDRNYRSIAYLVAGSRSEILNELYKVNNDIKSMRSVYQVDDWDWFCVKVKAGDIHTFYYDKKWAVDSYFGSNENKTVIENVIDILNSAPSGDYTIINMVEEEEEF